MLCQVYLCLCNKRYVRSIKMRKETSFYITRSIIVQACVSSNLQQKMPRCDSSSLFIIIRGEDRHFTIFHCCSVYIAYFFIVVLCNANLKTVYSVYTELSYIYFFAEANQNRILNNGESQSDRWIL